MEINWTIITKLNRLPTMWNRREGDGKKPHTPNLFSSSAFFFGGGGAFEWMDFIRIEQDQNKKRAASSTNNTRIIIITTDIGRTLYVISSTIRMVFLPCSPILPLSPSIRAMKWMFCLVWLDIIIFAPLIRHIASFSVFFFFFVSA